MANTKQPSELEQNEVLPLCGVTQLLLDYSYWLNANRLDVIDSLDIDEVNDFLKSNNCG